MNGSYYIANPMEKKIAGGDALVVGGGAIGCAIARSLARKGLSVTILERDEPGDGATRAAAGMLAPVGEAGEPGTFLELGLESLRLYPDFAAELEEESGISIQYLRSGKLQIAFSEEEIQVLRARHAWASEISPDVRWVDPDELPRIELAVSPEARGALLIPHDHQVDSRSLGKALWRAAEREGVRVRPHTPVNRILTTGSRVSGVALEGGEIVRGRRVVLAAGCWSGRIRGLPRPLPVRPVRGQMVAVQSTNPPPTRMIASRHVYLVPRTDGAVLVGATIEEAGFHNRTTDSAIRKLLKAAAHVVPSLRDAPIREAWAGLRPGTPDGLPLLGEDPGMRGLFYATGHYRNGILLAPVTAQILTEMIVDGSPAEAWRAFRPDRFSGTARGVDEIIPGVDDVVSARKHDEGL